MDFILEMVVCAKAWILQVEVLKLKTADFGWTCVRPGGVTLEAPTRETIGFDPIYDDPAAPEDGIDAARVFIWDLHPEQVHRHPPPQLVRITLW